MPSIAPRYALVTGCSTGGMGWHLAHEFASRGIHTFATLRSPSKAGTLSSLPNVTVLPLDITSAASISACVAAVSKQTGGRLDFLYNNAGVQNVMPLADQDLDAAREFWETNFWGYLSVTQSFLPLLVEAKGFVANAGSIRAHSAQAWDGLYAASKAAVHALTATMEIEFRPLGVGVVCVHTGVVETAMHTKKYVGVAAGSEGGAEDATLTLPPGSYYTSIRSELDRIAGGARAEGGKFMQPDDFAKRVVDDILARKTGDIWRGTYASTARVVSHLPPSVFDAMSPVKDAGLVQLRAESDALATKDR